MTLVPFYKKTQEIEAHDNQQFKDAIHKIQTVINLQDKLPTSLNKYVTGGGVGEEGLEVANGLSLSTKCNMYILTVSLFKQAYYKKKTIVEIKALT